MKKTKLNFFEQIYVAVTKPMQYFRLTKISGGRLTGFIFLFVLVTGLFFLVPILYSLVGPNGINSYLGDNIPAFRFSDGEFHVEERFEMDDDMNYVLIDTTIDKFSKDDIDVLHDQVILVSKTNMITYQYGRIQDLNFKQLGHVTFDNKILKLIKPLINLCIVFVMIFYYLILVAAYFLSALLYSLVGLIVSLATNANLKYSTIFKSVIYGKVTSSILFSLYFMLLVITPLYLSWFMVFGIIILIDCAYVVYGTMSHNSEAALEDNLPT
jgi:hypothetical protein